jgi:hypothetical protein
MDPHSPLTLRLDKETRERVTMMAQQRQMSVSEAIREAIDRWIDAYEARTRPYEKAGDLIGIVSSGETTRSAQTGRGFKQVLINRRKRA